MDMPFYKLLRIHDHVWRNRHWSLNDKIAACDLIYNLAITVLRNSLKAKRGKGYYPMSTTNAFTFAFNSADGKRKTVIADREFGNGTHRHIAVTSKWRMVRPLEDGSGWETERECWCLQLGERYGLGTRYMTPAIETGFKTKREAVARKKQILVDSE